MELKLYFIIYFLFSFFKKEECYYTFSGFQNNLISKKEKKIKVSGLFYKINDSFLQDTCSFNMG